MLNYYLEILSNFECNDDEFPMMIRPFCSLYMSGRSRNGQDTERQSSAMDARLRGTR